jgi:hypothetical protein
VPVWLRPWSYSGVAGASILEAHARDRLWRYLAFLWNGVPSCDRHAERESSLAPPKRFLCLGGSLTTTRKLAMRRGGHLHARMREALSTWSPPRLAPDTNASSF